MEKHIQLPLTEELAKTLHAGDTVYLSGTIYTSRDAGHKRMCEALARGEKIPFDPTDATIARSVDTVFCQQQQRHGTVYNILQMADALRNRLFTADQRCRKLGCIDLTGAHLLEMGAAVAVNLF